MVKSPRMLLTGLAVVSVLAVAWIVAPGTGHRALQVRISGAGQVADGGPVGPGDAAAAPGIAGPFYIVGSVAGLFPGATRPLVLYIIDPYPSSITVSTLTTTVGPASRRCPASNLSVTAFTGRLHVEPHRFATLTVQATMPHSTGDACQGALFPLTYQATATVS